MLGQELLELRQDRLGPPEENAGVPEEPPAIHVLLRRGLVGLLAELFYAIDLLVADHADGLAPLDIAKARVGPLGLDADRDEAVGRAGGFDGRQGVLAEGLGRLDPVIGAQRHQHRRGILVGHQRGGEADARRAVAPHGLGDNVLLGQHRQGLLGGGRVVGGGDDQHALGRHHRQHALDGLLDERAPARQRQQLLGPLLPAQRPKPRAGPAGHNHNIGIARGIGHGGFLLGYTVY